MSVAGGKEGSYTIKKPSAKGVAAAAVAAVPPSAVAAAAAAAVRPPAVRYRSMKDSILSLSGSWW